MKKIVIAAVLLASGMMFAQEIQPKYEVVGNMVKATYFYENGQIKQEGSYLDGKLHGKWISYNLDGSKQAMGEYEKGQKTGKWFFWSDKALNEVDFANSRIAEVKKWSKEALVKN
ncbi:Membrane-binding protein [Flavobacterium sp. 9AF]|uniref:toxin-antitoxin system YwqK family antitoxin n=1 Tax=Flavobacterium sp. 9AF TaxID=2653142 RepID=UPI0012EFFFFD|nr:membrane-binding protein [Flavobacterium sp. 9AF]VXB33976.1 Membrane-binding protein [Flavobacterium sp. 9AF]